MSGRREVSIDGGGVRRLPWASRDLRPSDRAGPPGSAPVFVGQAVVRPSAAPPLRRTTRSTRPSTTTMTTRAATCECEQTKEAYWFAGAMWDWGRKGAPIGPECRSTGSLMVLMKSVRCKTQSVVAVGSSVLCARPLGRASFIVSRWRVATLCPPRPS
uniref:Uncharacterized protein n=1 Tax=Plectus sambesii TaxID=2011161 RepID=A0A914UWY0_9BILA